MELYFLLPVKPVEIRSLFTYLFLIVTPVKSLVRLPRPAAAAAYIHCQELLDSLVWTFENQVSEGAMRNNGRLDKDEVAKLETKVLEKLEHDQGQLRRMLLAKWLLNEGRQKLSTMDAESEENGSIFYQFYAEKNDI